MLSKSLVTFGITLVMGHKLMRGNVCKDLINIMTNLAMVTSQVFGIVIGNEVRLENLRN